MEAEIAGGKLGDKGLYKLEFKEGKLCVEVTYDHAIVDAGIVVKLDAESVIEAIKKAIPGQIDDAVLDLLKLALKK